MATAQHVTETRAPAVASATPAAVHGASVAWRECCLEVIQAALQAVCLHPGDAAPFQKMLLEAIEDLKEDSGEDVVRSASQQVAAELARHNQVTQKAITKTMSELRETATALSLALSSYAGQSETAAPLAALQELFASASTAVEFEVGRKEAQALVDQVALKERDRSLRQDEFVHELQARIAQLERAQERSADEAAQALIAQAPTIDGLTGVPNGVAAREAILNAQASERPPHVAVIHIQSLDVLNARFGQRIGDQIVLTCCQHLASNLCRGTDRIFRWRGPAFVALLDRDDSPAGVGREVSHACNSIASSFFGEPNRSILIPVRMAYAMIPLESRLITDVFDSIERFIVRAGRPAS